MIGDRVTSDGIDFEVVWAGGEGLIPERLTKVSEFWTPPKRVYNKKNTEFWNRNQPKIGLDNLETKPEDSEPTTTENEFELPELGEEPGIIYAE